MLQRKRILAVCLAFLMAACLAVPGGARAATSDELEEQKEELEDQKEETEEDIEEAEQGLSDAQEDAEEAQAEADELEEEYESLNADLQSVSNDITEKQEEIDSTEAEIEETQAELEETQEEADEQYEAMKLRIKYMYENSTESAFMMLFSSESISEFLNRADYLLQVVEYDEEKLDEYEALLEEIEEQKAELEEEQEALEEEQTELNEKQEELDALVAQAGEDLEDKNEEVSAAETAQEEYEEQIEALEEEEASLEEQIADAQLALAEQIAAEQAASGTTEDTSGALEGYTDSDLLLLAALIQAEADNQSYEGKLAVGSVVMNRVKSSYFPNTVSGVIYQESQFTPASNGHLALILEQGPNSTCISAAEEVLNGYRNVSYLFFCTTPYADYSNTTGVVIGDHYFYSYNWQLN